MTRITKKQQHLNSLQHDIEFFQKEIQKKNYPFWFQGELYNSLRAKETLNELLAEQTKIVLEKDYKPWKEVYA